MERPTTFPPVREALDCYVEKEIARRALESEIPQHNDEDEEFWQRYQQADCAFIAALQALNDCLVEAFQGKPSENASHKQTEADVPSIGDNYLWAENLGAYGELVAKFSHIDERQNPEAYKSMENAMSRLWDAVVANTDSWCARQVAEAMNRPQP